MTVTITSLYDDRDQARAACDRLRARFGEGNIRLIRGTDDGSEKKSLWTSIKETFLSDEDRSLYGEGIRRGAYLLHAQVEEQDADEVCALLEESGPVDLDERERSWRGEGWQPGRDEDGPEPRSNAPDDRGGEARPHGGRRQTGRGGARVRSYVSDEPGGTPNLRDAPEGKADRGAADRPDFLPAGEEVTDDLDRQYEPERSGTSGDRDRS